MQDEDQELSNLNSETVQNAIDAVKARAWDINPFTVADELKVSRPAIYRHAEIMKLIRAARGSDFAMDVQTAKDFAWQLKQLEEQNNELKEKLAIGSSNKTSGQMQLSNEISDSLTLAKRKEADKSKEGILNLANNGLPMSSYFNQLAHLPWKDIETVYYFRVSSLKDYARNLFNIEGKSGSINGDSVENAADNNKGAISYGSLAKLEANRRHRQVSSISPFAQLKSGSSGTNQIQGDPDFSQWAIGQIPAKAFNRADVDRRSFASAPPVSTGTVKHEDVDLPLERLTGDPPIIEPVKEINKLETKTSQIDADLHGDLASKIRAGLVEGDIKVVSQEVLPTSPFENAPADAGGWLSLESQTSSVESGGWIKFETQAQPLSTQPFLIEPPIQADLAQAKLPEAEDKIQTEIKLIPLFKDKPITQQNSASYVTSTGDKELIRGKRNSGTEDKSTGPRDELRDLIQSHINNAVEQMAEFAHGYSIGTGKEFEVWLNNPARSKFVGSTKSTEVPIVEEVDAKSQSKTPPFKPRVVPPDVRKACLILGVRPDNITYEVVQESWKKAIAAPGVHPDLGGDTELAVYLNTAKDVLMRFLDAQAPKLGKKFGPNKVEKDNKSKADKPKNEQ